MEQKEETEESNAPSVRPVRLMTGSPKPKRRWLQFRLRTLVLFITTAAVVLGRFGHAVASLQQRRSVPGGFARLLAMSFSSVWSSAISQIH
jgi:hypothetical protein